jgi:hypothetical protein
MAWPTTIHTWATGETLTAANMNAQVRDALNASGPHLLARKASDETVSASTALQDDDALTFAVAANEIWDCSLRLLISASSTGNLKFSFGFPTSGTLYMVWEGFDAGGTFNIHHVKLTATDGSSLNAQASTTEFFLSPVQFLFVNAGNAGNVTFRWAQNSSAGSSTVKANSTLWGVKLA